MLSVKSVKPKSTAKSRKRIGRGKGSGTGTYAGRGLKGQRSRSGGKSGLKLRGLKATFKGIPKRRGFTSPHAKLNVVNIAQIESRYKDKGTVHLEGYKVLGQGELTKSVTVYADKFSETAKEKIQQKGGKAITCGKRS